MLDQPVSCFGDDGTYLYINDAGLKVLVLDDDLDALVLVRAVLESSHAVVKTVSSVDIVGEGGSSLLYRTTNGAGTWSEVAHGSAMTGFEIHPNDAKHLYIFDAERGWLSSADGGTR